MIVLADYMMNCVTDAFPYATYPRKICLVFFPKRCGQQDRNIFIAKEAGPQFIIYFRTVLGRLERSQEDNCYAESCVSSRKCPVKID